MSKVHEAVAAMKEKPQQFAILSFMMDESSFKVKPRNEAPQVGAAPSSAHEHRSIRKSVVPVAASA